MDKRLEELRLNLTDVQERISRAAEKSGRKATDIHLVVVTKTYPAEDVVLLQQLGVNDFGENRVQELLAKTEAIPKPVNWHLIGRLQRNKVRQIVGKTALIHSVDSERLAREIAARAEQGQIENILLQVNITGEDSKQGLAGAELLKLLPTFEELPALKIRGLMTMAEFEASPERLEETFRKTRKLLIDCQNALSAERADHFDCLSMGMTNDFEIAVRCGATHVRIGSAILGQRPSQA